MHRGWWHLGHHYLKQKNHDLTGPYGQLQKVLRFYSEQIKNSHSLIVEIKVTSAIYIVCVSN